ncbi:BTB/POZ domain-containing protein [Phanerochaete sordida]|uniref:BTB/POZ domain-containing protein n=1 Tax=Phanerochaete sordida TaxID=48140 RepID=A0A9P3G5C3_9APHY|nr:BTB/POZ domain-containing protein [Phanerochaete sordida]
MTSGTPAPVRKRARSRDAPSKRHKIEEVPQGLPPATRALNAKYHSRDDRFWFADGNIVLEAQGMLFKVHSSVLALHSDVLKGLLHARPLPAGAGHFPKNAGHSLVVTGDNGDALARLLETMYLGGQSDWFRWKMGHRAPLDFAEFRLVTLLAVKYNVKHVLDEATERLEAYYPSDTLWHWRAVKLAGEDASGRRFPKHLRIRQSDSIAVVQLADQLGLPHLRPAALYECCRARDQEALLRGVAYGGETVRLSEDDVLLCLAAHQRLVQENTRILHALLDGFPNGAQPAACATRGACRAAVARLAHRAVEQNIVARADPLDGWYDLVAGSTAKGYDDKVCARCQVALVRIVDERARAVWDKLGEIFHVYPWPLVMVDDGSDDEGADVYDDDSDDSQAL